MLREANSVAEIWGLIKDWEAIDLLDMEYSVFLTQLRCEHLPGLLEVLQRELREAVVTLSDTLATVHAPVALNEDTTHGLLALDGAIRDSSNTAVESNTEFVISHQVEGWIDRNTEIAASIFIGCEFSETFNADELSIQMCISNPKLTSSQEEFVRVIEEAIQFGKKLALVSKDASLHLDVDEQIVMRVA